MSLEERKLVASISYTSCVDPLADGLQLAPVTQS